MIWYQQGDHHGVIKNRIESPDQPTRVEYEVWSREPDGQPGEWMATYTDRDLAVSRVELLDRFRETARAGLLESGQWRERVTDREAAVNRAWQEYAGDTPIWEVQ